MTARVLSVLGTGASVVIIYFDVGTSWSLVIVSFVKMYDIISEEISTTSSSKHDRGEIQRGRLDPGCQGVQHHQGCRPCRILGAG